MTHSGGKPHAVGDNGQRYEVSYLDGDNQRKVIGWASTPRGVMSLVDCVRLHPTWDHARIIDRERKNAVVAVRTMERRSEET